MIPSFLRKYIEFAKVGWQKRIQWRGRFVLNRIRSLIVLFTLYFLWTKVFPEASQGYGRREITEYLVLSNLLFSFIFHYSSDKIADDIALGRINNNLLKPVDYLVMQFTSGFSKRLFNLLEGILETALLFIILNVSATPLILERLRPILNLVQGDTTILYGTIALIFAAVLFSLMDYTIGLVAFWTQRAYGPRFVFRQIIEFSAGRFMPLTILPEALVVVFQRLPFSYTLFFPLQIWLGHLNQAEIISGILIQSTWVLIALVALYLIWKRGLRVYSAVGG